MSLFRGLTEDAAWSPLPSSQPSHGSLLPLQQRTESSSWCRTAYSLGLCPPPCPPRLPLSLAHSTPAAGAPLLFLQCTGCEGPLHMLLVLQGSSSPSVLLSPVGFLLETYPGFRKVTLSHSFSILLLFYFSPWHLSLPIYYICFTYLFIICFPTGASGQRFLSLWLITASQYLEQHPARSRCSVSICEICTSFIHSSFI